MLGVDVNSECIQMLEVSLKKQCFYLQNSIKHILPTGRLGLQLPIAQEDFKTGLKSLSKQIPFRSRKCLMALPVNQVLNKTLPILSDISTVELKKYIQREIMATLPATNTDIVWDYLYVSGTNEINTLIAQREPLYNTVEVFKECGLHLKVIEVESFSLERAWRACYPELANSPERYGIVLLRQQQMTMILVNKNGVLSARAASLELTENNAEILCSTFAQLLQSLPDACPSVVFLAGECANTESLSLLISAITLPIKLVEFGKHIHCDPSLIPDAPTLFLTLGLALWGKY